MHVPMLNGQIQFERAVGDLQHITDTFQQVIDKLSVHLISSLFQASSIFFVIWTFKGALCILIFHHQVAVKLIHRLRSSRSSLQSDAAAEQMGPLFIQLDSKQTNKYMETWIKH